MPALFCAVKRFNLLTLSFKNIRRKTFRSGILAFSIALVVCIIVFGLSFIFTVTSSIKLSSERLGADLLVIPVGASRFAEEVLLETESKSFFMDKKVVDQLREVEGIDKITAQTYLTTISGVCCDVPEAKVVAFNQDTDFVVKPWLDRAIGRRLERGEAIVGYESFLNISQGLMEINASLFGNRFRIVGTLDKTGTGLDNAIFIGDENIQDIIKHGKAVLRPDQVSVVFTRVKKGYDPYVIGRAVEGRIVEVDVIARKDIGKNIINTLRDMRYLFSFMVIISTVLSVFLTWSIFSAITNERAREVGIMRAIGAKEIHIVRVFMIEIILIGIIGSAAGILAGTSLSLSLEQSFTILKSLPTQLDIFQRIWISAAGLAIGTGVCVIGALAPITRIRKTEPLTVIKEA